MIENSLSKEHLVFSTAAKIVELMCRGSDPTQTFESLGRVQRVLSSVRAIGGNLVAFVDGAELRIIRGLEEIGIN